MISQTYVMNDCWLKGHIKPTDCNTWKCVYPAAMKMVNRTRWRCRQRRHSACKPSAILRPTGGKRVLFRVCITLDFYRDGSDPVSYSPTRRRYQLLRRCLSKTCCTNAQKLIIRHILPISILCGSGRCATRQKVWIWILR